MEGKMKFLQYLAVFVMVTGGMWFSLDKAHDIKITNLATAGAFGATVAQAFNKRN